MGELVDREPARNNGVVVSRLVVVQVCGVVGNELFTGVFVAVDGGVTAVACGHAVGVVPCGLLDDSVRAQLAHYSAHISLPVGDVGMEFIAVVDVAAGYIYSYKSVATVFKGAVVMTGSGDLTTAAVFSFHQDGFACFL